MDKLLKSCVKLAREAGDAVMEVYNSGDFEVELKSDNSPLTQADKAANDIIVDGLKKLSEHPVISEEGSHSIPKPSDSTHLDAAQGSQEEKVSRTDGTANARQTQTDDAMRQEAGRAAGSASRQDQVVRKSEPFWLVDPVDGTKEFIRRNGEFTVNIGLIENGAPVLGVVFAPAKGLMYFGSEDQGSFKQVGVQEPTPIESKHEAETLKVVASRSHKDPNTEEFLKGLGNHEEVSMGSSLKICLVADGTAAIYPRFAPTMLWDTAAADAVLRAAGGTLKNHSAEPLNYDPSNLKNPFFICRASNYANLGA